MDILKSLHTLAGKQGDDIASARAHYLAGLNNILLCNTAHTEQHAVDVAQFITVLRDLSTQRIREMLSMTQRQAFVFEDNNAGQETKFNSQGTRSTLTMASSTRTAESESDASLQHDVND